MKFLIPRQNAIFYSALSTQSSALVVMQDLTPKTMADSFKITSKQFHTRGEIFRIDIDGSAIEILFTHHALERIKQWEILPETVAETLLFAEEVVVGHRGRFIAHKRYGDHLIRAVRV